MNPEVIYEKEHLRIVKEALSETETVYTYEQRLEVDAMGVYNWDKIATISKFGDKYGNPNVIKQEKRTCRTFKSLVMKLEE
jgi:hypothetical protein